MSMDAPYMATARSQVDASTILSRANLTLTPILRPRG